MLNAIGYIALTAAVHEPAHLEGHMEKGLAQGFVLQGRPRGPAGGLLLNAIGYLVLVSAVIILMVTFAPS